jgi:hypothetical protein
MSEYVSIIILVRRSVSRDDCVQTWNNAQQSEVLYVRQSVYMDNNKYLYRFRNPVKYWVVQITLTAKHTF